MNRLVGNVFKVLGISIILMFLSDALMVAVDTVTVNYRINNIKDRIAEEIIQNNAVPNASKDVFVEQLKQVMDKSDVVEDINTNMSRSITVDGKNYASVGESNVGKYGDMMTLVINVDFHPRSLTFNRSTADSDGSFLSVGYIEYSIPYIAEVPALRQLK